MNLTDNKFNRILDITIAYLLGLAAVISITISLLYSLFALMPDIWFYTVPSIIYACIFILMFTLMFKNKKTMLAGAVIFGVSLLTVVVYSLLNSTFYSGLISFASKTSSWLQGYVFRISDYNQSYGNFVIFGLTFIVSLFIYIFNIKKNTFLPYFITGAIIFIAQSSIMKIHTAKPMFYLFIILTLIYWFRAVRSKLIKDNKHKQKLKYNGIYTVYMIPCCVILILSLFLIPPSTKPLISKEKTTEFFETVKLAYKTIEDMLSNKSRFFSIKNSGFNDGENFLGGYLLSDSSVALKVKATSSIYLKGRMYEEYTGYSWETNIDYENIANEKIENTEIPVSTNAKQNNFSLIYSLNTPFEYTHMDFIEDVANRSTVEITYENVYTSSIFLPQYSTKINFDNIEPQIMRSSALNLITENNNKRDFTYKVEFQKYKYGDADLIEYLKVFGSGNFDINAFDSVMKDSNLVLLDKLSSWEMDEKTRALYTQLPNSVTERTRKLAHSLTDNYDNRYDKIKALEIYLKDNYSYSKRIPNTPENQDFVDYFLFDLNSGYCTYYATALSIMCRILDIPTRYVEGYVVPNASDDGYRYVTNDYAHAWTEVYFEGIGFIPFESTPIYNEAFYATEKEYLPGEGGGYEQPVQAPVIAGDDTAVINDVNNAITLMDFLMILISIILIAAFIIVVIVLFNNIRIKNFFKHVSKKDAKHKIQLLYRFYIDRLTLLGVTYQGYETPYEYANRAKNVMNIDEITRIFVESFYGNRNVTEETVMEMKNFYNNFLDEVKKKTGTFNFISLHYIRGKI